MILRSISFIFFLFIAVPRLTFAQKELQIKASGKSAITISKSVIVSGQGNSIIYNDDSKNLDLLNRQLSYQNITLNDLVNKVNYIYGKEKVRLKKDRKNVEANRKKLKQLELFNKSINNLTTSNHLSREEVLQAFEKFLKLVNSEPQSDNSVESTIKTLKSTLIPLSQQKSRADIVRDRDTVTVAISEIHKLDYIIFPAQEQVNRFRYNNKFGFCINNFDHVTISPQYDYASDFSEGYSAVKKSNQLFFVNKKGKEFLKAEISILNITGISPFKNGISIVKDENGYMFYLKKDGKPLLGDRKFAFCSDFVAGKSLVQDLTGAITLNIKGSDAPFYYIDSTGNNAFNKNFETAEPFNEQGIAMVSDKSIGEGYYLINSKGNQIGNSHYKKVSQFSEGVAPVARYNSNNIGDAIGVTRAQVEKSIAKFGGRYDNVIKTYYDGFVDTLGNIIISNIIFEDTRGFRGNYCILKMPDGKFNILNKDGLLLFKSEFDGIEPFIRADYFKIIDGGKVFYYGISNGFLPVQLHILN